MIEAKTIKLNYPININGATLSELKLRRPNWKDLLNSSKKAKEGISDGQIEFEMVVDLTQQSPSTLEQLDIVDYKKVVGLISDFFNEGQESKEK